ncbi:hypothetical protein BD779DRAFT_169869 [Infundibulicybe gibba]|nr:hypothetical protein BD779DRAFT_169869 [Infundibulicybe gibba]
MFSVPLLIIASAIDLTTKIIAYVQDVKDAGEDRPKLQSEVTVLKAVLRIANDDDISNSLDLQDPFNECYQALQSIVKKLDDEVGKAGERPSKLAEIKKNIRWPFRQGEIKKMLDKIERLKSMIIVILQVSQMRIALELKAIGQEAVNGVIDIKNHLDDQKDQMAQVQTELKTIRGGQELKEILELLSPPDFKRKHRATLEKHTSGTGEWFLEHPTFLDWQRGKYNVLWCPGARECPMAPFVSS